jgi:hypothetical protein
MPSGSEEHPPKTAIKINVKLIRWSTGMYLTSFSRWRL